MENERISPAADARRVAQVARELSLDLLRALESAVPCALADAAGDLSPERLRRIAACIFYETKARFAVHAAATLLVSNDRV